jgi:hypothetical protein
MPDDTIRYDLLVQDALRGMVRDLLADAAKKGLPGEHHFFITFDTAAEGVRLSERLRAQYPEEMTVVLQYQFRELKVTDAAFEVVLSFGGVPERLHIPFDAIKGFADPSVQFALQFEALTLPSDYDDADEADTQPTQPKAKPPVSDKHQDRSQERSQERSQDRSQDQSRENKPAGGTSVPATRAPDQPAASPAQPDAPAQQAADDKPGAEVVRLDRFRKK